MVNTPSAPSSSRPARFTPTQQVIAALVLGSAIGWWMHHLPPGEQAAWIQPFKVVREMFLRGVKLMIAPLVFASVVQGIAGAGDMKKVGRIGFKSLLYFEVVTGLALLFGLAAVNFFQPGAGVVLATQPAAAVAGATAASPTLVDTLVHTIPVSLLDAMARNDVLQTVVFAVVFALGIILCGEAARPVVQFCEALTQIMFKVAGLIMKFAPLGVFAALAITVAGQGSDVLFTLGKLIVTVYVALVLFVVLVFGGVILALRIPLVPFARAVREPFAIAFATASSEAALPKAFEVMRKFGVPAPIVGFVIPAGYTFNLDGSAIYLSAAAVFVAQAAQSIAGAPHFGWAEQLSMLAILMVTSKGIAAVPRASLVVLIATLESFHLPVEGALMILGVDMILDMARTSVNVVGNCLASIVVARWEGEFDPAAARASFAAKQ